MTRDERRAMWQTRIEAFKESGESSVTAWCAANNISIPSMYNWLKKDWQKTDIAPIVPQWLTFDTLNSNVAMSTRLTLAIGVVSIQIEEGFNPTLLGEVLQMHVK